MTLVETYLRGRCITCPLPAHCLRHHASCWHSELKIRLPAMVSLLQDIHTNEPCGAHRTYLKSDGSGKITDAKAKKMLGRSKGAAIKLTRDEDITYGLGICEGVETGLSIVSAGYQVWALGSAGAISEFPVLAGVDCLTVFADNDAKGIEVAEACARRWADAGREARIMYPSTSGQDWNDWARTAA